MDLVSKHMYQAEMFIRTSRSVRRAKRSNSTKILKNILQLSQKDMSVCYLRAMLQKRGIFMTTRDVEQQCRMVQIPVDFRLLMCSQDAIAEQVTRDIILTAPTPKGKVTCDRKRWLISKERSRQRQWDRTTKNSLAD